MLCALVLRAWSINVAARWLGVGGALQRLSRLCASELVGRPLLGSGALICWLGLHFVLVNSIQSKAVKGTAFLGFLLVITRIHMGEELTCCPWASELVWCSLFMKGWV